MDVDKDESIIRYLLFGLGFRHADQDRATSEFSGGWRMRIALAQALYLKPKLLLLDEPTNHLDLNAAIWLTNYLCNWKNTLIVISHDKTFINEVCDNVIHLHEKKLNYYKGNYDNFLKTLGENERHAEKEWNKLDKKITELKKKGTKGETLHKMELEGSLLGDAVNITDILSEGEQHVVALAGFLAELSIHEHKCPIVLDDPVCSLDHIFREKIANRLAKESLKRQVLIFTHDIAFLLEIGSALEKLQDTHFTQLTVQRIGNCLDAKPWHTMKVKDRIKYLQPLLASIKSLYTSDKDKYNREAGSLYGLMRETWEAAVEEILFHKVISRHQREIKTLNLRYVVVKDEDFTDIYKSMTKCSEWMIGHDKSNALDINRPDPKEIEGDIKSLGDFLTRIDKRDQEIEKARKKLIEPQATQIG